MEIQIAPGRFVIAVSGGVDSMALLHVLNDAVGVELIIAHFDHGIRQDSYLDKELVESEAKRYGLKFEYTEGKLGAGVSEALARKARYDFLNTVMVYYDAAAIITAHHQDDVLETAVLNLSRGTGWRGLISLSDTQLFKRPLLNIPKTEIIKYARDNDLTWREDSTNSDEDYLRNYIRHTVMPQFGVHDRTKLVEIISQLRLTGGYLENLLSEVLAAVSANNELARDSIRKLPENIIQEILIAWWRQNGFYNYETKTLKRAVRNIQLKKSGLIVPLKGNLQMMVGRKNLALIQRER